MSATPQNWCQSIDFQAQLRYLLVTVIILFFLLTLDNLTTGRTSFDIRTPQSVTQGRLLLPEPRQLGDTSLVFHTTVTPAEKRILTEQIGGRREYIECRPTWPEYAGFALAGLFGLSCFWFIFSVVGEEWTAERAQYVVMGKLTAFAALYFTYGIAAGLGWVWMRPEPFWAMGSLLLLFGVVLKRIPHSVKPKSRECQKYILVKATSEPVQSEPMLRHRRERECRR